MIGTYHEIFLTIFKEFEKKNHFKEKKNNKNPEKYRLKLQSHKVKFYFI